MSRKNRIDYFSTLFLCGFFIIIFQPDLFSSVLLLIGGMFPASFRVKSFVKTLHQRRYRISTVGLLYSTEKGLRGALKKVYPRAPLFIRPHLFSFSLVVTLRLLIQDGHLFFWLLGALCFEIVYNRKRFFTGRKDVL